MLTGALIDPQFYPGVAGATISIIFELMTIVLTWVKTVPAVRQLRLVNTEAVVSFSSVIFCHGKKPPLLHPHIPH